MADDIVFSITAEDDASKAIEAATKALNELAKTAVSVDAALADMDTSSNKSNKRVKRLADSVKGINTETAKAAKSFKEAGQGARGFADAVRAPGRLTKDFASGLRDTITEIERFTSMVRDIPDTVRGAIDDIKHLTVNTALLGLSFTKSRQATLTLIHLGLKRLRKNMHDLLPTINKVVKATGLWEHAIRGVGIGLGVGLVGAATKAVIGVTQFADSVKQQARFLDVSQGALAGQVMAYEAIGRSQEDAIATYTKLNTVLDEAQAGNETYIDLLTRVGIEQDNVANTDLETVFTKIKTAVDDGTLSYRDAAEVLGQDLTVAIDDVRDRQEALSNEAVDAAAWWQEQWEGAFDWWDDVQLATKELVFSIVSGEAVGGGSAGPTGSATGVQLPSFDPNAPVYNPVTGKFVSTAANQPPSHLDPRARGVVTPTEMLSGGLQTGSAQDVRARGAITPAELFRGFVSRIPGGTTRDTTTTTSGGGGGVGDTRDVLGERNDRAFARLFEDAQRRAVRDAIDNADFSLARDEARALHDLRSAAAKTLETEGERALAEQQADFDLLDTLGRISDAETRLLEGIRTADEAAAKELLNARRQLEEINAREQAKANAKIAGAQAFLIAGSQFGDQYTAELEALTLEVSSLQAAARLLPADQRATQLGHIDTYRQSQIEQINQQFLSQPLITPEPLGTSARGVASTQQGRTLIINVSVGGSVLAEQELADIIFDVVRTGDQTGVLQRG